MRKFVILEEQPDYYKKVQGVTPKGHVNIEVRDGRGKLIVNVENLKVDPDEEKFYKACLIGLNNKDYVDVDLGVIVLNDKGRGSIEWKFDPASVGGTSLSIDKFNNILVKEVDMNNENKGVVVPLSGYIYKKDGSLVKLMKKQLEKESPKEQEIQKIEETKPEEPKVDDEKVLQEIELKEDLQKYEVETEKIQVEQIQEDTYVPSEEEVNIEENIESTCIEEEKIEPDDMENTLIEEQEIEHEELPIETQDSFKPIEVKTEGVNVEELFFEDIVPLDLGLNNFDQSNMDVKYEKLEEQELQKMEYSQEVEDSKKIEELKEEIAPQKIQEEQEEIEEQVESTGTIWIDLETGEEVEEEEEDDLDSHFIHLQNNQVTYNYGDYIDNTYGSKIDPYMDTVKNYSMQVANYTMDILKFFNKVEPFSENLRDCTWWKIEHSSEDINRGFLPFYNYLINVYYPYPLTSRTTTCQSMIEKYGHYIFGTVKNQEEVKYYVYGVPGKFTIADHPYNGATGFNTWLKNKDSSEDLGYWLIYIDALSGKIVNPVNPTIPTR